MRKFNTLAHSIAWVVATLFILQFGVVFADDIFAIDGPTTKYVNGSFSEVMGLYKGYDLYMELFIDRADAIVTDRWGWIESELGDGNVVIEMEYSTFYNVDTTDAIIRIPDSITETYGTDTNLLLGILSDVEYQYKWIVTAIYGSGVWKTYDLNPNNEYMTCVDNVIFSKDQTTLMSYARYDERTEYIVPDGTTEIAEEALNKCNKLQKITLSETVEMLDSLSLSNDAGEVEFANLDVEIDRSAFGRASSLPTLTTYAQPTLTSDGTTIRWEEIEGATYYEVYQKLNDGEYRLLGTTSGGGCRFTTLKEGKEYTFAVKAYAEIPAANYDPETDEGVYPESFLIEGTMSEDIVLVG